MSDPNLLSSLSTALEGVVAHARASVVSVHSRRSRATGFVWKPGLVVTADEALADEGEIAVKLADGTSRPATIAGRDHTTDIALLRVDTAGLTPTTLVSNVPALGALSVVVAAERGTPTA
ncbi:MAG: trypsin-like peptidase domain-containing protein, partial [Methylobacteriaceae bacterium]|nr:trypsin-like peptidase domain-containing protein [Methylobacteriaceae bacterium]